MASERRGVMVLMYDLPRGTAEERKNAADFRKNLLKCGYMMLQESVYIKLMRNREYSAAELWSIKSFIPPAGDIRAFDMSLNEFEMMQTLLGETINLDLFAGDMIFA